MIAAIRKTRAKVKAYSQKSGFKYPKKGSTHVGIGTLNSGKARIRTTGATYYERRDFARNLKAARKAGKV